MILTTLVQRINDMKAVAVFYFHTCDGQVVL